MSFIIKNIILDYYYSFRLYCNYKPVLNVYNGNFYLNAFQRLCINSICMAQGRFVTVIDHIYMWPCFNIFCKFNTSRKKYSIKYYSCNNFISTVNLPANYWYTWPTIDDLKLFLGQNC